MGYTRVYDGGPCLNRVDFYGHDSGPQIKEGTACSRDSASQRQTTAPPPYEVTKRSCQTRAKRPHVCAGDGDATCTTRSGGRGHPRVSLHFPSHVSLLQYKKRNVTYFLLTISNAHLTCHHKQAFSNHKKTHICIQTTATQVSSSITWMA